MNPLLLLSGVESLYSFKDVQMNALNFELLDGLILTIFALRVGDQFHSPLAFVNRRCAPGRKLVALGAPELLASL